MAYTKPEIPERKVFLSRKTSFPIFSGDVGDSWLQLLNLALRIGSDKQTDAGPAAEALNAMVTIGLPVIAEDLEVEPTPPEDFPEYLEEFFFVNTDVGSIECARSDSHTFTLTLRARRPRSRDSLRSLRASRTA